MTGWRGRLRPEHLPHALADEDVDDRLRQLPYSWRHRSEPVPSRGRLRVVRRQLGDPIERLLKFASLRGLEVGRLNAGLEPLDQLRPREPRGGIAALSTEIGPLLSSWLPGARPLTSAGRAVGEHPRPVVATEGSDWIVDSVAGRGTDEQPTSFFVAHQVNQPARSISSPNTTQEGRSSFQRRRPAPRAENCRTAASRFLRADHQRPTVLSLHPPTPSSLGWPWLMYRMYPSRP